MHLKNKLLILAAGLVCLEISFIMNGSIILDGIGSILIVLSFLLFSGFLYRQFQKSNLSYRFSLAVLVLCLLAAFGIRSTTSIAKIDDGYHRAKVVAYSYANSFTSKMSYIYPAGEEQDSRLYYIDFVESVWGIFWRWMHIDLIIVLFQGLILLVLWQQLCRFFDFCGIQRFSPLLALAVVLNMQIYWTQQGSGYIDGISGFFCALTLLNSYRLLKNESVNFEILLGLSVSSILCFLSKMTLLPVGLIGLGVVLWKIGRLNRSERLFIVGFLLAGLSYLFYHYALVWFLKGSPLYPVFPDCTQRSGTSGFYHYLFEHHPIHKFLIQHHISWRFIHVIVSWLFDYKYRLWVTPDPWVGGNGILWTYCFVPVFFIFSIRCLMKPRTLFNTIKQKENILLLIIAFYWLFLDIGLNNRFMLGMNTFLLALSLQWIIKALGEKWKIVSLILLFSFGSYFCAARNAYFFKKDFSVLQQQYNMFPNYYSID